MPTAHPGAAYGWRARIGLLQPSLVSDTNPFEFYLMAPEGVQMVLTSLGVSRDGPRVEAYARAMERLEEPIRRVVEAGVDVIVQAGVPPIVTRGWGFEDQLLARVRQITDLPFATDVGCCIAACAALEITKVAILATEQMQEGMADYLGHAGIEVVATSAARMESDARGMEPLSVAYRSAVELHRAAPATQGVLIPGAFRPTVGMIQAFEEDTGIAAVSSAQALMWRGLQLANVNPASVTGFGKLFQIAPPRAYPSPFRPVI